MAYAFDPDNSDPELRRQRNSDDAWRTNFRLIREHTLRERQEESDRAYAASLVGIPYDAAPDDRRQMAMLPEDYPDDDDNDEEEEEEEDKNERQETIVTTRRFSIIGRIITPSNRSKPKKCVACAEWVARTDLCVPCRHAYCIRCLKELFTLSMQDESLMPPRCCSQEIPIALANLTRNEIENFNAKRLEFSTMDRLYCSQPTCSTFISPALIINNIGTCPKPGCSVTTCSKCKAASHGNLDCSMDEATAAFLDAADKAGWARCFQCGAMIELSHGCFHMTCRCRAEFCYVCSKSWKTCECPHWNEERLYFEARARIVRTPAYETPQTDNVIDADQRVERMVSHLRANIECRHKNGWIRREGGGKCEVCTDYLPLYLNRCYQCHFLACNRCRHNRL